MKLLILDVETSSLEPETGHLVEVGLVRWSVEHRTILSAASWVVAAPDNPAAAINGIPPAALAEGAAPAHVMATTKRWAESCDVIAAHSDFDRKWFPDLGRPWIDTAWDIDYPRAASCSGRRVVDLCLGHGLAVLDNHRALPDCLLLARLLERCGELGADVEQLVRRAMRPKVKVVALVSFEEKEAAKAAGFRWDPHPVKAWWRMMAPEDVAALPFRCRVERAP
jgi:DNA polymerase-3 subunit epsilon